VNHCFDVRRTDLNQLSREMICLFEPPDILSKSSSVDAADGR
jgi:hypothetical protein